MNKSISKEPNLFIQSFSKYLLSIWHLQLLALTACVWLCSGTKPVLVNKTAHLELMSGQKTSTKDAMYNQLGWYSPRDRLLAVKNSQRRYEAHLGRSGEAAWKQ